MHILFIINSLKQKSGSERVAIELANQISLIKGFNITIINRESIKNDTAYPLNSSIQLIACKGNILSFFKQLHQHLMINDYDVTGWLLARRKFEIYYLGCFTRHCFGG